MTDELADKESSRSAIILVILAILVAVIVVTHGLQTLIWAEARMLGRSNPWLNDVPKPMTLAAPQSSKAQWVHVFLYQFKSPWGDATQKDSGTFLRLNFKPGQAIAFYDPAVQLGTIGSMKSSDPAAYQTFANTFAGNPIDTNYDLYKAIYTVSPSQLTPWLSSRDALRLNALLIWKLGFGFDSGPGLYSFDTGQSRGFQFGNPASGRPVALRIFDTHDRQFRFTIVRTAGSSADITQQDVDTIIQSFEPIPLAER
jgi:hypothetical protein